MRSSIVLAALLAAFTGSATAQERVVITPTDAVFGALVGELEVGELLRVEAVAGSTDFYDYAPDSAYDDLSGEWIATLRVIDTATSPARVRYEYSHDGRVGLLTRWREPTDTLLSYLRAKGVLE
jgi:hypothetical protein